MLIDTRRSKRKKNTQHREDKNDSAARNTSPSAIEMVILICIYVYIGAVDIEKKTIWNWEMRKWLYYLECTTLCLAIQMIYLNKYMYLSIAAV